MNQLLQWRYRKVLSCCLLYLLTFLQAQAGESIAVLDLEGRGISSFEAASLTDRLRSQLVRTGKVTVVERGQMNQILSEQDFQTTGCTSNECAVEIGQMLGVTSMVAGSIGKIGSTFTIDLRTIDVVTGKITNSIMRDYRGEIDGLIAEMGAVAAELVAATGFKAEAPLVAKSLITIGSQPPGALILIDGLGVGNTPQSGLEVEPNQSHAISINLVGYQTLDTTLFTEAGQNYELNIPMERLKTWLSVLSTPPGAIVSLYGRGIGATPLSRFEITPNQLLRLSFRLNGYQPLDTAFVAQASGDQRLNIRLRPVKRELAAVAPPREPRPTIAPAKKGSGLFLLVLAAVAGGGYYGYTEGWFGGELPGDGNEPLTVGNPPPVPSP